VRERKRRATDRRCCLPLKKPKTTLIGKKNPMQMLEMIFETPQQRWSARRRARRSV